MSELEISSRKGLFDINSGDEKLLRAAKPYVHDKIGALIDEFYEIQTGVPEISLLIGDAGTLNRLKRVQKAYVLDLFSGYYDLEYVNNRLHIGMVHKRMGIEPKLYLSATQTLKGLVVKKISEEVPEYVKDSTISAVEKLMMFDVALVFDTYIRSLILEIELSKQEVERYANSLEVKVKKRTEQLEKMSSSPWQKWSFLGFGSFSGLSSPRRPGLRMSAGWTQIAVFGSSGRQEGRIWPVGSRKGRPRGPGGPARLAVCRLRNACA